MDGTVTIARRA